jgi:murein L,D-transpeptidase YafK
MPMLRSSEPIASQWRTPIAVALSIFVANAMADGTVGEIPLNATGPSPAYLLELPDTVSEVLIAETGAATLWRFKTSGNRVVAREGSYMSIGRNGVGKQRAWDRKTPLGIYFITQQLDTSRMHEKYGVAAFPLDYPNAWDRRNSRTGDGIWLHGVDRRNPQRPPRDTNGCLAVPNEKLLELGRTLEPHVTPLIVARKLEWLARDELSSRRTEFRAFLDRWRYSLEQGDLLSYLSLYHEDFQNRGMDKATWSAYRQEVFKARKLESVELKDVLLIADPEESELYLSRFTQVLHNGSAPVTTTKRLYWRRESQDKWRILSEDAG